MNDLDWQASTDPQTLLRFLAEYEDLAKRGRKLRLLAAGCCRFLEAEFFDRRLEEAIEGVEHFASGPLYQRKLEAFRNAAEDVHFASQRFPAAWWYEEIVANPTQFARDRAGQVRWLDQNLTTRQRVLVAAVVECANPSDPFEAALETVAMLQALLGPAPLANAVREVFGNPFTIPDVALTWRTRTVLELARTINTDQRYDLLPILGDALMDTGCDDEAMLQHCQQATPHMRGCWLLDRLLVRE